MLLLLVYVTSCSVAARPRSRGKALVIRFLFTVNITEQPKSFYKAPGFYH